MQILEGNFDQQEYIIITWSCFVRLHKKRDETRSHRVYLVIWRGIANIYYEDYTKYWCELLAGGWTKKDSRENRGNIARKWDFERIINDEIIRVSFNCELNPVNSVMEWCLCKID